MPKPGTQFQSTSSSHSRLRVNLSEPRCSPPGRGPRQSRSARSTRRVARSSVPQASENAADQENANQPDQDHKNNTIAMKTTDPAAIAAAYQRTRPVSVLLNPR